MRAYKRTADNVPEIDIAYVKVDVTFNEKTLEDTRFAVPTEYRNLVSRAALRDLPKLLEENPTYMNSTQNIWILASSQVDQYIKNHNHNSLTSVFRCIIFAYRKRQTNINL